MSLHLDPPRTHGTWRVAVLCECVASGIPVGDGLVFTARKIPAAIVLGVGKQVCAFDLQGRRLDLQTLAIHCPALTALMLDGSAQPLSPAGPDADLTPPAEKM